MKLDKIKLSGFKSFADQTTIHINSNLTAVVGPNGCGKSNVIDAVRWVMGESSAKHLRGDNMADVIFNGSSNRKPLSLATVELIFDNSEGKAAGEYARYTSISIKRQVSREGQSVYMLNGSRCRRKDITDLFLGTGLGSRSYAIIEQGTISRIVESKAEDLRLHIEEAAGISKYKERRQETETRMRHTRENLERLDDLREEVEKQLANLKKQAEKAEKYTELKKEERRYKKEWLAIRWSAFHQTAENLENQLQGIAKEHNRLFMQVREIDQSVDAKRLAQKDHQHELDQLQERYYQSGAEISRLQQAILHNETSHDEVVQEINRLKQQAENTELEYQQELGQLEELRQNLYESEENQLQATEYNETVQQQHKVLQQQKQQGQSDWEEFLNEHASCKESVEIQRMEIDHCNRQIQKDQQRLDKLQSERSTLIDTQLEEELALLDQTIETITNDREDLHLQLETRYQQIIDYRQQIKQYQDRLHQERSELQAVKGKITSLELLQQHAMGKDNQDLVNWLELHQLQNKERLAESLDVEEGWEKALETVLGDYLEAVCVDDIQPLLDGLNQLSEQSLTLWATDCNSLGETLTSDHKLAAKVKSPWNLNALLAHVYCAEDLLQAYTLLESLHDYEWIVTRQGDRLGKGWFWRTHSNDSKIGVLQRERELRILKQRQIELHDIILQHEDELETAEAELKSAESDRETLQQRDKVLGSEYSVKSAQFSAYSAKQEQQQQRLNQISLEIEEGLALVAELAENRAEAEFILVEREQELQHLADRKAALEIQNRHLNEQLEQSERYVHESQQQVHELQRKIESLKASQTLTERQLERLQQQNELALERIETLEEKLQSTLQPMDQEKNQLDELSLAKQQLEQQLTDARLSQKAIEDDISDLTKQHHQSQRDMEHQKDLLDKVRFEQQDCRVRQQTLQEQLSELQADPETVCNELSEDAQEQEWKQRLDDLTAKIERLGSINLTAIEDYQVQSERLAFLNDQHADLTEALNTLDQAISKIDLESRQRFKETFDKINTGLQEKFPKLFGGGQAYLELTDDSDMLEAGVNIIARPPGKRNSSIHLLSGGEKALTAVALVFSIFDLNPAPFCLLDEVDAPLDDANVVRFSQMVENMAESVQFLYISHNKVTMEIAQHLVGVTMKEPGVSRLVSVDIEEAVEMAES